MTHTPESLAKLSDDEIDVLVAEVQWTNIPQEFSNGSFQVHPSKWLKEDGETIRQDYYHPTQDTESGRSQAWELMVKYELLVLASKSRTRVQFDLSSDGGAENKKTQRAVAEAVILSQNEN